MQIIDSSNTGYPGLPDSLIHIAPISDINLIQTKPNQEAIPPAAIGKEPEHGYCYYFQKTALAQQSGDSELAYSFAQETLNQDLHPQYAPDLAPMILAFLEKEDYDSADSLISGSQIGSDDRDYLCTYWTNKLQDRFSDPELQNFYKSHGCL